MKVYLRKFENAGQVEAAMKNIGVDEGGISAMVPKAEFFTFLLKDVDPRAANIVKQEFLAKGAEASIAYHCLTDMCEMSDVLLMATKKQYSQTIQKFGKQPFGLAEIAAELESAIQNLDSQSPKFLTIGGKEMKLDRTLIMGILNVTPDSFSDGGQFADTETAIAHGVRMADEGCDVIDVGGESTRPGAEPVSVEEELRRVIPVISGLAGKVDVPISIDTTKPEVAEKAIESGARMVNDVSALGDQRMAEVVAGHGVPVVLMHMQGEPRTMQSDPRYDDVVDDILAYLSERVEIAVNSGVAREAIIIDPGIGFGKTVEHNLELLARLGEFCILGLPVMAGASRKSFIGKVAGGDEDTRLEGSLASAVLAAANGASIVRVHDVAETKKALTVADGINGVNREN